MTKLEELTSWDGEQSLTIPPFETDSPCICQEAVKEARLVLRKKEGLAMGKIQGVWSKKPPRKRSQSAFCAHVCVRSIGWNSVSVNIVNNWNVKQ